MLVGSDPGGVPVRVKVVVIVALLIRVAIHAIKGPIRIGKP